MDPLLFPDATMATLDNLPDDLRAKIKSNFTLSSVKRMSSEFGDRIDVSSQRHVHLDDTYTYMKSHGSQDNSRYIKGLLVIFLGCPIDQNTGALRQTEGGEHFVTIHTLHVMEHTRSLHNPMSSVSCPLRCDHDLQDALAGPPWTAVFYALDESLEAFYSQEHQCRARKLINPALEVSQELVISELGAMIAKIITTGRTVRIGHFREASHIFHVRLHSSSKKTVSGPFFSQKIRIEKLLLLLLLMMMMMMMMQVVNGSDCSICG